MQSSGYANGQTSNQNYERPSPIPQSWYEPLSRPVINQNISLPNSEAIQIAGFGLTLENGIRIFQNPMFETILGTRGFTNSLFEFTPGGFKGFPAVGRETTHVPPIVASFTG